MGNRKANFEHDYLGEYHNLLDVTDGTLLTEDGHSFPIHRYILARCSRTFSELFCGREGELDEKDILIPDIKGEVLRNILTYIYHGKIHVTKENICNIFVASHNLSLENLLQELNTILYKHLSVNNCLDIYMSSLKKDWTHFQRKSYRFIETHFEELVYSRDTNFHDLPIDKLMLLLKDDSLRVQNEKVVWHAIVKWVENYQSNRLHRLPELLLYLRACDVDDNLLGEILTHDLIAKYTFSQKVNFGSTKDYKNFLDFQQCIDWKDRTDNLPILKSRKPPSLNLITGYLSPFEKHPEVEIYVTYDENIDLWRQIMKIDFIPTILACIDNYVYVFNHNKKLRYNIFEEELMEISQSRHPRGGYEIVQLGGFLYTLGGQRRSRPTYSVKIYNPEENAWHKIESMLPVVYPLCATTINGCIYVVGTNTDKTKMLAQMYNPTTRLWQLLPEPPFTRCLRITIAAYKKKLFVIGVNFGENIEGESEKKVLVFDPIENNWNCIQNLPYKYTFPRALVTNGNLIVSENPFCAHSYPPKNPVQWNNDNGSWEEINESSPLFNIHRHIFVTQEIQKLNNIFDENKIHNTAFEESPFV